MDNEYNIDFFSQAGNLMDEVQEAKKNNGGSDEEIFTLTVECSAFFTLVCC